MNESRLSQDDESGNVARSAIQWVQENVGDHPAIRLDEFLASEFPQHLPKENIMHCTICNEPSDDLTIGSDGTTRACADCTSQAD